MRSEINQIPYPDQYIDFFRLFNERDYFESHEVLEDLWIMETGPEKEYYKGMIMVTIALEHWRRGNAAGAWRLWRDGDARLAHYPDQYMGFELGKFRNNLHGLMKTIIDSEGLEISTCRIESHPVLSLYQTAE